MSPPTEQLIRDYLNRLSVVARDRMSPDERRELVDRTRKLIERRSDFAGRPTTLEVGKVLARLGEPAGLVERELRRLSAERGGPPAPAAAAGDAAESGSRGFLAWVLRRDPGPGRQPGWPADWRRTADPEMPTAAGRTLTDSAMADAEASGQAPALLDDQRREVIPGAAEPDDAGRGDVPPVPAAPAAGPFSGGPQQAAQQAPWQPPEQPPEQAAATGGQNGTTGAAGTRPLEPQWPSDVARDGSHDYGRDQDAGDGLPVRNGRVAGSRADGGGASSQLEPPDGGADSGTVGAGTSWPLETRAAPALGVATRRVLSRAASWARARPLEAAAVALLGPGGIIFPPVFLLGAVVALGSRLWDYRDKWIGLVLPIVLAVIGLAAGIAVGGRHHGLHDGWVYLNVISRLAALVGAGYLAWRSTHGRRQPSVPPWNKSRRSG